MREDDLKTVLLLESDPQRQVLVSSYIEERGVPVRILTTAEDVVSIARAVSPFVVIVECEPPGNQPSGYTLCENLLAAMDVRVMLTGVQPTREHVIRAVRAGASDFLVHPASPDTIYTKLDKIGLSLQGGESVDSSQPLIDFGTKPISTSEKVDLVIKRAAKMRALPHSVAKVLQVASASDSASEDLVKAVQSDPAISAMITKLACSAWYGRGKASKDLNTAIVRLGFRRCKELVISVGLFQLFSKKEKAFGFTRLGFWLHSISCGLLAEQIGEKAALEQRNDLLTMGLLHDIGKIILDDFLPREFQIAVRQAGMTRMTLFSAEQEILDRTHVTVGAGIIRNWKFPQTVADAIAGHHDHDRYLRDGESSPSLAGAVYLANQMAKALMVGEAGDFVIQDTSPTLWRSYGIEQPSNDEFIDKFYAKLQEFCEFLGLKQDELGVTLGRQEGKGLAAIVDPEETSSVLLEVFLRNKGFVVNRFSVPDEILQCDEPVQLCLLRPPNPVMARQFVSILEPKCEENRPVICILPEGMSVDELGEARPWLATVTPPLDCFELTSKIAELVSQRQPSMR